MKINSSFTTQLIQVLLAFALLGATHSAIAESTPYKPVEWTKFVSVQGQPEPVPEQWLQDTEAKTTHSLKLPDTVPKPVPFEFGKAWWKRWLPGEPKVAVQYFNHLCKTEAVEWIFKKVSDVDGLYFARPQATPTSDMLADPHGPEMPWIQRVFILQSDNVLDNGTWFIQPPIYNYQFVEQPRREIDWQSQIKEPYVRLFGYTREYFVKPGQVVADWNIRTPMQVIGIPALTARYGYTWRGLKRERDREHGIAGGEVLIYDLQTKEVLAVRRQFLIAAKNPRGAGKAMWEVAASCAQLRAYPGSGEFTQFAFDVLKTTEPSMTGGKK